MLLNLPGYYCQMVGPQNPPALHLQTPDLLESCQVLKKVVKNCWHITVAAMILWDRDGSGKLSTPYSIIQSGPHVHMIHLIVQHIKSTTTTFNFLWWKEDFLLHKWKGLYRKFLVYLEGSFISISIPLIPDEGYYIYFLIVWWILYLLVACSYSNHALYLR